MNYDNTADPSGESCMNCHNTVILSETERSEVKSKDLLLFLPLPFRDAFQGSQTENELRKKP